MRIETDHSSRFPGVSTCHPRAARWYLAPVILSLRSVKSLYCFQAPPCRCWLGSPEYSAELYNIIERKRLLLRLDRSYLNLIPSPLTGSPLLSHLINSCWKNNRRKERGWLKSSLRIFFSISLFRGGNRRRSFDTPQQRRSEFRSKNKHKRPAPFEYSRHSNRHILFKNYPRRRSPFVP